MIITRTPFRISFVGGGSDIPSFFEKNEGAVLSTSINKYMYIITHNFFYKNQFRAKYSQTETVKNLNLLKHPIIRETLKMFDLGFGIEVTSIADIPAGTGLGSSSAFTVGLLHNILLIKNKKNSKKELAELACDIEINKLKEPIGKQDQYASAFGGLNLIRFSADYTKVEPINISTYKIQELENNLLLFFIGQKRNASRILLNVNRNLKNTFHRNVLKKMVLLVDEMQMCLSRGNIDEIGTILHENWKLKKQLSNNISNSVIDDIYTKAIKAGATGGKLLGAGAGGFMLFCCPQNKQNNLRNTLESLIEIKFKFESEGSKLIYKDNGNL